MQAQTHPDLHLIYRQLNRDHPEAVVRRRKALDIGVDVVRHFVIDRVGLTPARGRAKVFIIREADRITPQAQNALLKTLEEPPEATVLVLLVAALDRLLPTTLSRCQIVPFDPLPADFTRARLAELLPELPAAQVKWYAACSSGSLGTALERAEDQWYELNQQIVELQTMLSGRTISETIKVWTEVAKTLGAGHRKRDPDISEADATRRGLEAVLLLVSNYYADVLRTATADSASVHNEDLCKQIGAAAKRLTPDDSIRSINRIALARRQIDLNANSQLVVETLLNDLSRIANRTAESSGAR